MGSEGLSAAADSFPVVELLKKMQVPAGGSVRMINAPDGLELNLPMGKVRHEATLFFAKDSKTLMAKGQKVFEAARGGELVWIAYPKAGQLGTDLNRDRLWARLKPEGIQPVRQISIDETWSALRFRPSDLDQGLT